MAATRLGCVQPTCKKQQKKVDIHKNAKHVDTSFLKSFRQNLWLSLKVIWHTFNFAYLSTSFSMLQVIVK
jgi:hypothetical protein